MLRREVAASNAHIAPHQPRNEAFNAVAETLNGIADFVLHFYGIISCDCYKRLQKLFMREDNRDLIRSGVGEEVTEEEKTLFMMCEALEEQKYKKVRVQEWTRSREQKKLETAEQLVTNATSSLTVD